MLLRVLVMCVAALVALLIAEGSWSLLRGDSLIFPRPFARQKMLDDERMAAAALTEGPFIVDPDPQVRFRTKPAITREFFGVPATTDRFGMRVRSGPEIDGDAQRVVVLGDSYVFGFGVADGETLSHHLEVALAAAVGARAPRPVVLNVACTGWTFENQMRYLCNHWGRLAPDLVVTMPLANDLDDSYAVSETGQPLKLAHLDRPYVGVEQYTAFVIERAERRLDVMGGGPSDLTWPTLLTDITPESQRRWDGWIEGLRSIAARLELGADGLFVAHPQNDAFQLVAQHRLARDLPEVTQFGLLGPREAEDTLDGDPHPNGRWNAGAAHVIASELVVRDRIVGGDLAQLPRLEPRYDDRRLPLRSDEDLQNWRQAWRESLASRIDLRTLDAVQQIYGGVEGDGTVGASCAFGLRARGARRVQIVVELLPQSSGLYPLEVTVFADGSQLGTFELTSVTATGPVDIAFALPENPSREAIDVRITSSARVAESHRGSTRLASFRLVRAAAE